MEALPPGSFTEPQNDEAYAFRDALWKATLTPVLKEFTRSGVFFVRRGVYLNPRRHLEWPSVQDSAEKCPERPVVLRPSGPEVRIHENHGLG